VGSAVAAVCCCRCAWLTLNRQWHGRTGNVRYRTYSAGHDGTTRRYDVTITVDRDGGDHLNPAEFAVAAEQAASAGAASIVSAHTASGYVVDGQSRGDYWSSLNRRERQGMLSEMPAATLSPDALKPGHGRGRVREEDTMRTIEIQDPMGHHIELGQIPDEDVELASGAIDSLAITGEAVTPLLAAQLRAFLAQSGIRLADQ
jgi:hypothetical protein